MIIVKNVLFLVAVKLCLD